MSNKKINTREIIVNKALEMYNSFGVEYVGVRELAKELQIKGGNITYYFPTKNDLLREISNRLSTSSEEIFNQSKGSGLYSFLNMIRFLYINQYQYRSYFISLPLWLQQDIEFAQSYHQLQDLRRTAFMQELKELAKNDYLLSFSKKEFQPMLETLATTSRLWICEATLDGIINNETLAVNTYLQRFAGLLNLFATPKGKSDIKKFLAELR